jgi:hypothetical protein
MLTEDDVRATGVGTTGTTVPVPPAAPGGSVGAAQAPLAVADGHRRLLGALLGGAGLVHLALAPAHTGTSAVEGVALAVAGWLQLVLAAAVVRAPGRGLLRAVIVADLAFVAAWAVSRTAGLPFGEHAGHAASAGFVDLTVVGLEVAAVLVAAALLRGPLPVPSTGGLGLAVPLVVAALVTGAIASPGARDHASGSHGDHAAGGHHGDAAAGDDLGFSQLRNGHGHAPETEELDAATQAELDGQLALTERLQADYPTLGDAVAAGYWRGGPFLPGLGTHYVPENPMGNTDGVIGPDDMDTAVLIYDGLEPTAPLAGFMFLSPGDTAPEGFAGPNDGWHVHERVCIVATDDGIDTPFGSDAPGVTQSMCDEVGGTFMENTGHMVHLWNVPGYESRDGLFAELNPAITCEDGTYYIVPVEEWAGRDSACRDAAGA